MNRIKFQKGKQKKFIQKILQETGCPSLRAINQFGLDIPYSTLKNYFTEQRTLPEELFLNLCKIANINPKTIEHTKLPENWGKIKGGKHSKNNSQF